MGRKPQGQDAADRSVTRSPPSIVPPSIVPLTAERWDDLVDLFGPEKGAASGCWCMWHRLPGRPAWDALGADGRRAAFQERVGEGPPPGLMAYRDGLAVGWVALAPREELPRFQKQKVSALPPEAGEAPGAVLALHCFFIRPGHRKTGLMRALTLAAIETARASGAAAVDACPIEPDRPMQWGEGFVGLVPLFQSLGFTEIARRSPRRPLMRLSLT
jgi:GNAT superfamily N-acetyltransferase